MFECEGDVSVDHGFGPDVEAGAEGYRFHVSRGTNALHSPSPMFNGAERDAIKEEAGNSMQEFEDAMPSAVKTWFQSRSTDEKAKLKRAAQLY